MKTKISSKRYAKVNRSICVSCGTCEIVCPMQAITIKRGCYAEVDMETCVGCGKCEKSCPANCINVMERMGEK